MQNEPTTTDLMTAIIDLQGAVSSGFSSVDRRFGWLETRFDGLETRLASAEGTMGGLLRGFSSLEVKFDENVARIDKRLSAATRALRSNRRRLA